MHDEDEDEDVIYTREAEGVEDASDEEEEDRSQILEKALNDPDIRNGLKALAIQAYDDIDPMDMLELLESVMDKPSALNKYYIEDEEIHELYQRFVSELRINDVKA